MAPNSKTEDTARQRAARILETAAALRAEYDLQPVSKEERDALWGEETEPDGHSR